MLNKSVVITEESPIYFNRKHIIQKDTEEFLYMGILPAENVSTSAMVSSCIDKRADKNGFKYKSTVSV